MDQLDYLLTKELEGRRQTLLDGLARGAPESYPDYCKVVGEFQGIQFALRALTAVRGRINVDDEDVA